MHVISIEYHSVQSIFVMAEVRISIARIVLRIKIVYFPNTIRSHKLVTYTIAFRYKVISKVELCIAFSVSPKFNLNNACSFDNLFDMEQLPYVIDYTGIILKADII